MNLLEMLQAQVAKLTDERDAARKNFERAQRQRDAALAKLNKLGVKDPLATVQLRPGFSIHPKTLASPARDE